ncbi:hypothetical protein [uncultured Methylobacterium sp.]|uniref:hypothetical protein n=1 Tax=uncultured Methylobacterium sp. TaxID=157278 RepID=UPI0035CB35A9
MTIRPPAWMPRRALAARVAALVLAGASGASAGEAADRYAAWHGCLDRHFAFRAAIGSRRLAADAALQACRDVQAAYLASVSASPLIDADDAIQARPALVARARSRLLGRGASL